MADWLVHSLVQIGGTAALLAVAGIATGKWLWKKIDAALGSYTMAYSQEAARVDARVGCLEKLAEEQSRLTRTVEGIKDEIAAQRTMHDNRWAFRKDVYVNILAACDALASSLVAIQTMQRTINSRTPGYESLLALQQQNTRDMVQAQREFSKHAFLAPFGLGRRNIPASSDCLKGTDGAGVG